MKFFSDTGFVMGLVQLGNVFFKQPVFVKLLLRGVACMNTSLLICVRREMGGWVGCICIGACLREEHVYKKCE